MVKRKTDRRELQLGLAQYDTDRRSVSDARGLFLSAARALEPQILESLETMVLGIYRQLFPGESRSQNREQASNIATRLGWTDELPELHDAARQEDESAGSDDLESKQEIDLRYPLNYWRDPNPNPELGRKIRQARRARGLSVKAEAKRLDLLPSELAEMERGCKPRYGLTSTPGAEPLRRALRRWGESWHLTDDWCFEWSLDQLQHWSTSTIVSSPLDQQLGIIAIPTAPPEISAYRPQLQTRKSYLDLAGKQLKEYCDAIDRLMKENKLKPTISMRSAHRHCDWLAGYQVYGWSQRRIAIAEGVDRAAVVRAINNLAETITLKRRQKDDPGWTVERIASALKKTRK